MKQIEIYTDGACSGNPGPGGWAAVLRYGEHRRELAGYQPSTTNNRMELFAAIMALQALKQPCEVNLHSDSSYLINAFEKGWLTKWQTNGWKTSNKSDVENKDLWQLLLREAQRHQICWCKVKGHADDVENNRCDHLARTAIKEGTQYDSGEGLDTRA